MLGHASVRVALPVRVGSPNLPAVQLRAQPRLTDVAPLTSPYFPAGQLLGHASVAMTLPVRVGSPYLPGAQLLGQASATEDLPVRVASPYLPAGHTPEQGAPVPVSYVPAAHGMQDTAGVALNCPGGHCCVLGDVEPGGQIQPTSQGPLH